jgi:LPXTG-site transpeptidase (sortase) family protein
VDAPISNKGVGRDGIMENPNGPEDVAWYDFSARPGGGGNVVMSGHLDYAGYGDAVFARLSRLRGGEMIEVALQNGTQYVYRVVSSRSYLSNGAPTGELLAPTRAEMLTLITCEGDWNPRAREYSDRLIVRAQLVQTIRTN